MSLFFTITTNWFFKQREIELAEYLWIWNEFLVNNTSPTQNNLKNNKYIKIEKIGKIKQVGNFDLRLDEKNMKILFKNEKEDDEIKEIVKECFLRQFHKYHKYKESWLNMVDTRKNWWYIVCEPNNKFNIEEDTLYPSKEIVSFPLNRSETWVINSSKLMDTIKIWDNTFFSIKTKSLIVNWELKHLGTANKLINSKILELLLLSDKNEIGFDKINSMLLSIMIYRSNSDDIIFEEKVSDFLSQNYNNIEPELLKLAENNNETNIIKFLENFDDVKTN